MSHHNRDDGIDPATPVRVLYMVGRLERGGAETTVATLVRRLDRAAFEHEVALFQRRGDLLEEVEACARVTDLNLDLLWTGRGVKRTLRLARLLRDRRVAILHSFGYGCDVMACVAGRLAGVPWIVTTRRSTGVDKPSHLRVYRLINPLAHRVLAVSRSSREWSIANEGLDPGKIETIPNAVDVARFSPRTAPRDGVVRIGTVGNVRPVKGADLLLDAFATLASRSPQLALELHVVGRVRNETRPIMETRIAELGLGERVHLHGERRDIPDFLRTLDVFAMPSLREGMSNAVLEALATGLPVVATAVGGNLENVREGEGGFLVRDREVESFAGALAELAGDEELRRRMGAFNRELAVAEYSIERVIAATQRFYLDLLSRRSLRNGT